MPDPQLILRAIILAAAVAAGVTIAALRFSGWPGRVPSARGVAVGSVLGLGMGYYLGCYVLKQWPHWPPREDQDRFLILVLPGALAVELLAALFPRSRALMWAMRCVVAAATARVLLHGTSYLTDLAGPGTREWSPVHTWLILGGLAVALSAAWVLLTLLGRFAPGPALPAALALSNGGAAATVMLSGYFTGGQLGLPLAAALAGSAAVMLIPAARFAGTGWLGPGLVGFFSLLVIGRFFGSLSTAHALLLFGAPLLAWLPLALGRWLRPGLRHILQVLLVGAAVAGIVFQAQQQFVEDSKTSPEPGEPSLQDYLDFGK